MLSSWWGEPAPPFHWSPRGSLWAFFFRLLHPQDHVFHSLLGGRCALTDGCSGHWRSMQVQQSRFLCFPRVPRPQLGPVLQVSFLRRINPSFPADCFLNRLCISSLCAPCVSPRLEVSRMGRLSAVCKSSHVNQAECCGGPTRAEKEAFTGLSSTCFSASRILLSRFLSRSCFSQG